jgi:hypothetical protein
MNVVAMLLIFYNRWGRMKITTKAIGKKNQ